MTTSLTALTMSFGGSASDVLLCVQLAHRVWKACREAPRDFQTVSIEVASLHLVLHEAKETAHELSASKGEDLRQLINGCKSVLQELEELLQRYKSLGTQSRRTWDRLRWGRGPVKDIRQRLISSTASLTSFNTSLTKYVHHALCLVAQLTEISCSAGLARVEKLLQQLVLDHQSGRREGSVISTDNLVSAEEGDEDIWRQIARELDDVGITSDLIREHREYITDWIRMALEAGEFKEASPPADSNRVGESDIEADVGYNSPLSSSPLLSMREIGHIREDSRIPDQSPYRDQTQAILSPMPIFSPASGIWSPGSQEGTLVLFDVKLNVGPSYRYYCNMCNHKANFTTWFEILSHAHSYHGGNSFPDTGSPMPENLTRVRSPSDIDALEERNFTMQTLSQALESQLIPSHFPQLMEELYYSEICPFSECLAISGSPELNRFMPLILLYSKTRLRWLSREHVRGHFPQLTPFHDCEPIRAINPVFKLYVCETRGCWGSSTGFPCFAALEEHFWEEHPGLDFKRLRPGAAAHGYYLSFSGRRLRDIWATGKRRESETLI